MQQSNAYIVTYTIILTVVCAIVLALAALGLKPLQDYNIDLERKQNILGTVMKVKTREEASTLYEKRVKSYVIDAQGNTVPGKKAEEIAVEAEYKKKPQERLLPVYEILDEKAEKSEFFVIPVYGFGLWNDIWGFVALERDMNTIRGVKFDHKSETPGLGARITTDEIQSRFKGKKLFDGEALKSVAMAKGEQGGGEASIAYFKDNAHEVDGMSGATLTAKGVNAMFTDYFGCYEKFFKSRKGATATDKKISLN